MRTTKWPITDSPNILTLILIDHPREKRKVVFLNDTLLRSAEDETSSSHKHCTSAVLSGAAIIAPRWEKSKQSGKSDYDTTAINFWTTEKEKRRRFILMR